LTHISFKKQKKYHDISRYELAALQPECAVPALRVQCMSDHQSAPCGARFGRKKAPPDQIGGRFMPHCRVRQARR